MKGAWDSIHVFEVQEKGGRNAHYQLTSTVMLYMVTNKPDLGHMNLSGSMTRQVCLGRVIGTMHKKTDYSFCTLSGELYAMLTKAMLLLTHPG